MFEYANIAAASVVLTCFIAGLAVVMHGHMRTARDVAGDLQELELSSTKGRTSNSAMDERAAAQGNCKELAAAGLFTRADRQKFIIQQKLIPICGAIAAVSVQLAAGSLRSSLVSVLFSALGGIAGGYLMSRMRLRRRQQRFRGQIEFFLPIVMERIVMAVQSGLDVLPAILAVLDIEHQEAQSRPDGSIDPVSTLLGQVRLITEAGLGFEQSLQGVAARVESSALRHAFIHLGIAQRQGGELVMPLKELSDATQLCYQESVEEELAKMPVKATMPLLCTFAGLILCFLTAPLVQVITMVAKPMLS
jgi:Flp pilus assembly protein TadB